MGPEGIIPSLLVFVTSPTSPTGAYNTQDQTKRMEVIKAVREQMEELTSQLRIRTALKVRLPPAIKYNLRPSQI